MGVTDAFCNGQYKDQMKMVCRKTCGFCKNSMGGMGNMTECKDDDVAVEKAAGAWGVKKCAKDLCTGQFKDQMQPLCKKTCGLCDMGDKDGDKSGMGGMHGMHGMHGMNMSDGC